MYPDAQAFQAGVGKPQLIQQGDLVEPYGLGCSWVFADDGACTGVITGCLNPQAGGRLWQMPDETALYQQ